MSIPEFRAWFAADSPVEEVPFRLNGQECSVSLRAMDATTKDRFEMMASRLAAQVAAGSAPDDAADKLKRFLVGNTLVNWHVFRLKKDPSTGEEILAPDELPQKPAERDSVIRNFAADAAAWEWLTTECRRVNGYEADDEKNSDASSSS
jgi:hypothetical protein